ncbi:glycosyltransferase family 39 protein [Lichenicoccus sp.]|uniref:glycosyltransferase family 39 protein n=1 Tax=Lichenicoccus sp. TaxID=2781899 RepID=UPI003D152103
MGRRQGLGRQWIGFWLLLVGLTAVRLLVAALSPVSADEAYYWTWSRALAPGYLDHPPMVALWIAAGTRLCGDTALGIRLLAPLAAALGSLLLVAACRDLLGRGCDIGCGIKAAILLNATLLLGVGAVTMTPDTPLLSFWTAALAALGRVVATRRGAWWLAVGLATGLAMDSKYTALLTAAGIPLWLVATGEGRRWLRTPWPWLAAALALLVFAPVLGWNADHRWASFAKQGGRTGAWHPGRAWRTLAELVGGQAGLATPVVFVLLVCGIGRLARRVRSGPPGHALLVAVTVPAALVFVQHALGDRVQANWPGLLYPACAIAAAPLAWRWWRAGTALGFVLTALVYAQSVAAPLPLPRRLDVTLVRLAGWQSLAREAASAAGPGTALVADEYGLAAELAFAAPGRAVFAAEPRWRLFGLPHPPVGGVTMLLVRSARRKDAPDPLLFCTVARVGSLARGRDGVTAERYDLYRVTLRTGLPPSLQSEVAAMPVPLR